MNDIEVLEDFKNNKMQRDKLEIDQRCGGWKMGHIYKSLELNTAIENLLKERQSDKERIKELEKENESLVRQYEYQGALMVNEYFSKDQVFKLFIPKSLIKKKIEELKEQFEDYGKRWEEAGMDKAHPFYKYLIRIEAEIDILEELLKGE